jgi:hypothetical protein
MYSTEIFNRFVRQTVMEAMLDIHDDKSIPIDDKTHCYMPPRAPNPDQSAYTLLRLMATLNSKGLRKNPSAVGS